MIRELQARQNANVITILLGGVEGKKRKDFHCNDCGRIVFNYYNEIRMVMIGEVREVARPVDIMCSRCKTIYRII